MSGQPICFSLHGCWPGGSFLGKFISHEEFFEIKAAATQLWSWQIGLNILFKGQVELENLDVLDNGAQVEIFEKQTLSEVKERLHHLSNKINKVIDKILSHEKG